MTEEVKYTYFGRPIEELSKEELLEALKRSLRETQSVRDIWQQDVRMWQMFAEARK
jgi:hypothetical protein